LVGKKTSKEELSDLILFPTQSMCLIIPVGLGFLLFFTPLIYQYIFPKYLPGIHSAQILLYGAFFVCIIKNGVNYLVALNKQTEVFVYVIISLLISVLATFSAIKMNFSIEGVAFGTILGSLSLTTMVWISVFKNLGHTLSARFLKIGQLYTPFFLISGITILLIILIKNHFSLYSIVLNYIVFIILYILLVLSIPYLRTWSLNLFKRISQMA
jgi:O-antigen/teichoic acid export membrane protein